jgi:hypothetical protein
MVLRLRGGKKVIDVYEEKDSGKSESPKERNYLSLNIPPPRKDEKIPDFPDRMSCSRLQSFVKCPFAFRLQYVDGFKVSDDSIYLSRGKELHDMFYYASMTGMPEVIRSFDGYNKYPEQCENFIAFSRVIMNKNSIKMPLFSEKELYDENHKVLLYIDRIDENGKGVDILDYKSSMPKTNIKEYRFQLALYTYYVQKMMGLKVKRWGVMFTGGNGALIYEPIDQMKVDMIPEIISLIREDIADCAAHAYRKRRNGLCFNCKFKAFSLCDGAPTQAKERNSHGLLDIYRHEWISDESTVKDEEAIE